MKTDEQLKEFAKDFYGGKIFTSQHFSSSREAIDMIPLVFIPFMFLTEEQKESIKDMALIYEYYDESGPRSINGYPQFMSFNTLTKEELNKVVDYYEKIKSAMDSI